MSERGGVRQGVQGRQYPNRSDLLTQPNRVAPSQHYGDRAAREAQTAAAPLPQVPPALAALFSGQGAPPDHPGLFTDSQRPNEPVHAGIPSGPGPGPDLATALSTRDILEALARKYPTPDLDALIQRLVD